MPRPFIHVNFAADADGQSACGTPACISCETDWRRVHCLREQYDAVAVGGGTWNTDKPRLTVRTECLGRAPSRQPARVIFAGSTECDVRGQGGPLFVITARAIAGTDVTVIPASGRELGPPLESLYRSGIRSMLVEGGPTILHSFFSQGLADAVTVFVRAIAEDAAERAARRVLPGLPGGLRASPYGEGFLLTAAQPVEYPATHAAAVAM